MSRKRDIVEESADGLCSPASDVARKKQLVRRLVKVKQDPRVALILQGQLAKETEPALLQVLILGMGALRDPAQIPHLLPFLEHTSLGVVAATMKALCKLDPSFESETAHPLVVAKDDRMRAASIIALLSHNRESGMNALRQLATSSTVALRKTAIAVLSSSQKSAYREGFEEVLLEMFLAEQDPELLEAQIKSLAGGVTHLDRLKKVMDLKAGILAMKESDRSADSIPGRKLEAVTAMIPRSYERMQLSGSMVGTLEGQIEKQIEGNRKQRESGRVSPAPGRRTNKKLETTGPVGVDELTPAPAGGMLPRVILVTVVLGMVAIAAPQLLETDPATTPPVGVDVPVTAGTVKTSLGQVGDEVTVEGKVVRLFPRLKVVLVELAEGGLAYVKVPDKLPPVATEGAQVRAKGKILRVDSETAIHVETAKLVSASSLEE